MIYFLWQTNLAVCEWSARMRQFAAVTLNGGWKMRAWYDIRGLNLEDRQDVQGVKESQASIENLLAAEKARGFAANKIFLGRLFARRRDGRLYRLASCRNIGRRYRFIRLSVVW